MPIPGIVQPEIINIASDLRLRRYDGEHDFALEWYMDTDTVWLVDGSKKPYDLSRLKLMYDYLDEHGELYFIEYSEDGTAFRPIGDVTFWQEDMPIVIGDKSLRGKGLGRRVIYALVERARSLGYAELCVGEIYDFNTASIRCFESLGFKAVEKTEKGRSYKLVF